MLLLRVLHPALHELDHPGALRQKHRQTLADHVHRGEVFELPAELVVVPLLGLLQARDVGHQLVLLLEGRAVDPLEHLVLFTAPPVGPGHAEELDVLHPGRAAHVGAGAQVHELALLVETDNCVLRQVPDQLHLVGLALLLHEGDGLLPGELEPLQLQILPLDLLHGLLDLLEVVGGEVEGGVEVVIEPVLGGGADGQLHLGPEALDGLGQDMGGRMPIGPAAVGVVEGQQSQGTVLFDGPKGVGADAVDLAADDGLLQLLAEAGGDVQSARSVFVFPLRSVGEGDNHTCFLSFFLTLCLYISVSVLTGQLKRGVAARTLSTKEERTAEIRQIRRHVRRI